MTLSLGWPFSDHMVLQRDKPVAVWGQADAGARVSITFAQQTAQATTDDAGQWFTTLAPMAANDQPQSLVVTTSSDGQSLTLHDLLVGEVWLCSGQSNMDWTVDQSQNGRAEVAAAADPQLRLLLVPKQVSLQPSVTQQSPASWNACSPDTVGGFSAVGYFFGRELRRKIGVPVGLISAAWGGTMIETWISHEGMMSNELGAGIARDFEQLFSRLPELRERHAEAMAQIAIETRDQGNTGYPQGWAGDEEPAGVTWKDMDLPTFWQTAGVDGSGVLWFRRVVDLPANWAGRALSLAIGAADKGDDTYFNNQRVGGVTMADRPDAYALPRVYDVPGKLVKAGRNVIAVRVRSEMHAGGLAGPSGAMKLSCPSLPEAQAIPLTGTWRYAIEQDYGVVKVPPAPPLELSPGAPARLYNGMIHPLKPMTMRGIIWYQGESNSARAVAYRTLFPMYIRDMRRLWNDESLAMHFVQLANYVVKKSDLACGQWPMLREAQKLALSLPHTGMAVTIDIGDANDIHPRNKQDVGLRLAHCALHETYGLRDVPKCGPLLTKAVAQDGRIRLHFDHVYDGLTCRGEQLEGFMLAGADGQFVPAQAIIEGQVVVVNSAQITAPAFVRYAWEDNPRCTLYNRAGLPASPFRTDRD